MVPDTSLAAAWREFQAKIKKAGYDNAAAWVLSDRCPFPSDIKSAVLARAGRINLARIRNIDPSTLTSNRRRPGVFD